MTRAAQVMQAVSAMGKARALGGETLVRSASFSSQAVTRCPAGR